MLNTVDNDEKTKFFPKNFEPNSTDIICGRGNEIFNHPGNQAFRKSIHRNLELYNDSTKEDRKNIVSNIMTSFRPKGGIRWRFVRFSHERQRWYEISDELARQKIGQAIRESIVQRDPKQRSRRNQRRKICKSLRDCRSPSPLTEPYVAESYLFNFTSARLKKLTTDNLDKGTEPGPTSEYKQKDTFCPHTHRTLLRPLVYCDDGSILGRETAFDLFCWDKCKPLPSSADSLLGLKSRQRDLNLVSAGSNKSECEDPFDDYSINSHDWEFEDNDDMTVSSDWFREGDNIKTGKESFN